MTTTLGECILWKTRTFLLNYKNFQFGGVMDSGKKLQFFSKLHPAYKPSWAKELKRSGRPHFKSKRPLSHKKKLEPFIGKLDSYIVACLKQNMKEDEIFLRLMGSGWDKGLIKKRLRKIKSNQKKEVVQKDTQKKKG